MPTPPRISDAEWEVMNVLWDSSPLPASDVANEVCRRMNWHQRTVKTLLSRLVAKGALGYREEGTHYLYHPIFPRERYVNVESRSFVERVFGGRVTPALAHFVETMELSGDDVRELRSILDRKEKESERS